MYYIYTKLRFRTVVHCTVYCNIHLEYCFLEIFDFKHQHFKINKH